ncbi:MAG: UTP--glucose-1-phosphate uridylyltransferase, partial [Cyclobacteriaceae bacterium]|nr:UTP--glucose-1-phosphate uridylyltransferase [Cyclobacteriaceae bacterium]
IINSVMPVTQQLIDVYEQYQATTVAVEVVPKDKVSRYGIVGGSKLSDQIMEVTDFIEKPSIEEAPSNLAIAGRYILTPEIYQALEQTPRGKNNEVQLTDALMKLTRKEKVISHTIEGKRYDIGNKLDYLKTTVEFALRRKEFAKPFYEYLKKIVEENHIE